ncbi:nitrile hydratase accessory protein [Microbaculum marinum]|uniref:Nitrile hydratase accessory protein n=1 Tax=Microbaculum marinum TaxID=1764581 RepID=A0AAW9RY55_9HYPH
MTRPEVDEALAALPGLPRDADGPVFAEPWHAQAFALAVALNSRGIFTWSEWAETLGAEIAAMGPGASGDEDYYSAWLKALETILDRKGVVPEPERADRQAAWDRAARATPHGQPIELGAERK